MCAKRSLMWPAVSTMLALLGSGSAAVAASFTPLGVLPGYVSGSARGVSADGQFVAGFSESGSSPSQATLWTGSAGLVGLGDLTGGAVFSDSNGISADGSIVSATGTVGSIVTGFRPFRWTATDGPVELSGLPANVAYSTSVGISADGAVVVGNNVLGPLGFGGSSGYIWTAGTGFEALTGTVANPVVPEHQVTGVSPDGRVVVGSARFFGGASQAFYWSSTAGFIRIGDLAGGSPVSTARAASADGAVVAGWGSSASGREAFRWTAATGLAGLGDLAGGDFFSEATAISGDGSVVVGVGSSAIGSEAFVWTASSGMRGLFDVLVEQGASGLEGYRLATAWGISADGQWVVGDAWNQTAGRFEGYVAQVAPVPLPGAGGLLVGAVAGLLLRVRRRAPGRS